MLRRIDVPGFATMSEGVCRDMSKQGFTLEYKAGVHTVHLSQAISGLTTAYKVDFTEVNRICRQTLSHACAQAISMCASKSQHTQHPDHVCLAGGASLSRHFRAALHRNAGVIRERIYQQQDPTQATAHGGARLLYNKLCVSSERFHVRTTVASDISLVYNEQVCDKNQVIVNQKFKKMVILDAGVSLPACKDSPYMLQAVGNEVNLDIREGNGSALEDTHTIAHVLHQLDDDAPPSCKFYISVCVTTSGDIGIKLYIRAKRKVVGVQTVALHNQSAGDAAKVWVRHHVLPSSELLHYRDVCMSIC